MELRRSKRRKRVDDDDDEPDASPVILSKRKPGWRRCKLERKDVAMWSGLTHSLNIPSNWTNVCAQIYIYVVDGPAKDLYLEWVFQPGVDLCKQLEALGADGSLLSWIANNKDWLKHNRRSAYTVEALGHAAGDVMVKICADKRRLQALFIQIHGARNLVICGCCERRMSRMFVERDGKKEPVMIPWFECVSIPGFRGACGNCVYHAEGYKCEYDREPDDATEISIYAATTENETDRVLGPRQLNDKTCARKMGGIIKTSSIREDLKKRAEAGEFDGNQD